eukprot:gene16907-8394_t
MEDPFSVSPVGLTIINTSKSIKKYDITTSKDISKPLSFGRTDVGVMIEMHYHSAGAMRGHLHIDPSSSVDKSSQGIFFISVDPCTMPMSYWAVALFPSKNNTHIIRQFTASKTDSFIPVESANCGFKVDVVPEFSENHVLAVTVSDVMFLSIQPSKNFDEKFHNFLHGGVHKNVNPEGMLYGCTDSSAVQLINDYYFPELGEMCIPSKCEVLSPNSRRCFSNMLVGHQKTVNMTTDITVVECGRPHKVEIVMRMGNLQDELHAEFDNNRFIATFSLAE